jgi:predicted DNA-binding ribbon-helix-helix protein
MYQYQVPKKHHNYRILATLVAGLALIGVGTYVEYGQFNIRVGSTVLEYWIISLFLMVLGASALVVCLTSGLLLSETKEKLNNMLEERLDRFQETQVELLKHSFSVTGHALAYKLEDILAPRYKLIAADNGLRSIEPNPPTFEKLAKHIRVYVKNFINQPLNKEQQDKIILINGITLKDLVDPGNPLSNSITNAVKELSYEARKRSIGDRKLIIRAMMLSPHCEAINFRKTFMSNPQPQVQPVDEEVDSFFYQSSQEKTKPASQNVGRRLQGDIEYSVRAFKNLSHIIETKQSAVTLELKQTVVLPQAYFIITEDYIFIEQYHLARENLNGYYKCMVGTVPMLQFAAGSAVYENMRKHFEFLWNIESNKELNQVFRVEKLI